MPPTHNPLLETRRAGVVLHPTSLPGDGPHGELGPAAFHFIDWMQTCGMSVWQVLPLGPTHADGSPYQCWSAHAGNIQLISLEQLRSDGLFAGDGTSDEDRESTLAAAYRIWTENADEAAKQDFQRFRDENHYWLDDFALYAVIRRDQAGLCWVDWPRALRDREEHALNTVRNEHESAYALVCFEQYLFFRQWTQVRQYANDRGILVFGDMPIFVAYDSADVWANRHYFRLHEDGSPTVVAGVPPDYFSKTGQRWGNPVFAWDAMQQDGFRWWLDRLRTQLRLFDIVRVDHFRGFEAYWEIDAASETAVDGRWVEAPGNQLFEQILRSLGRLPLVAEDLGIITEQVTALRKKYALPGMKVLHFAFGEDATNPYLPHHHEPDSVVYTGTHDNNTTLGWYAELGQKTRDHVDAYLGKPDEPMPWSLIRAAFRSVAPLALVTMQDFLGLDGNHRMNTPGTTEGNWRWRFSWDQVPGDTGARIRQLVELYGRLPD